MDTGVCMGAFADHCLRNSTHPDKTKLPRAKIRAEAAPATNTKEDIAVASS